MALDIKPVLPTAAPAKPAKPAAADTPKRTETAEPAAAAPKPPKRRPRRQRGGEDQATAPRTVPVQSAEPTGAPPYAGQTKVHASASIQPSLWSGLEQVAGELAGTGTSASVSKLVVALLHFRLPAADAELISLARRWRRLRAGAEGSDPYRGESTQKFNLRIYPAQRERLDAAAELLRSKEGIRYAHSTLINALVHFEGPADATAGEQLLRELDIVLAGDLAEPDSPAAAA